MDPLVLTLIGAGIGVPAGVASTLWAQEFTARREGRVAARLVEQELRGIYADLYYARENNRAFPNGPVDELSTDAWKNGRSSLERVLSKAQHDAVWSAYRRIELLNKDANTKPADDSLPSPLPLPSRSAQHALLDHAISDVLAAYNAVTEALPDDAPSSLDCE